MLKRIIKLSYLFVFLQFVTGCNESSTNIDSSLVNKAESQKLNKILYLDVFLEGYVYYKGSPLSNHPVQILDENQNPFDYYPYNQTTDVAYTNSSGYYKIIVCGFHSGLRHARTSKKGITSTKSFIIPEIREETIYITRNFNLMDTEN